MKLHEPLVKHHETLKHHLMRRHWRWERRHRYSAWRYRRSRRVSGEIGNCGVGVTPQMCNRVINHGDMGTFSRPVIPINFDDKY